MPRDAERMLHRVVTEVFGDRFDVACDADPRAPHIRRAKLVAGEGADRRRVGLRATPEWFDLIIFDLDVSATLFEYDDEQYKEACLRELALVADAYLRGDGRVEQRRGILGRRPAVTITVDGKEWVLGRRSFRAHYPEDASSGEVQA